MHVGVETTVRVELGEFGIPGIDGQTDFVIPEMLVIRGKRLIKQFLGTRTSGQQGGGCGEYHEGMRIADLARSMGAVREHLRVPAAVLVVMKNAGQSLERRVGQLPGARISEHVANRIHMGHTAGDPRLDAVGGVEGAVGVQPAGTAIRRWEALAELQQLVGFGSHENAVGFGAERIPWVIGHNDCSFP